jgi:hypothetical protein
MFREDIGGAVEQFSYAVDLCKEFPLGNERSMASTLFTIGCCLQQVQKSAEAGDAFLKSVEPLRKAIANEMSHNNQSLENFDSISNDKLVQPSIFDNDTIKELKSIL